MSTLTHKGYGRIYCESAEDIPKVETIIKEMDEFEFGYLPPKMVAVFTDYPKVVYTHKFSDMNMDALTATCWKRGIKIWVFDSGHEEYPVDGSCGDEERHGT